MDEAVQRLRNGEPVIQREYRNKYNSFCLADDLLEPFRPLTDEQVFLLWKESGVFNELEKSIRERLLSVLNTQTTLNKLKMPLMESMHRMAFSLVRSFENRKNLLEIPNW